MYIYIRHATYVHVHVSLPAHNILCINTNTCLHIQSMMLPNAIASVPYPCVPPAIPDTACDHRNVWSQMPREQDLDISFSSTQINARTIEIAKQYALNRQVEEMHHKRVQGNEWDRSSQRQQNNSKYPEVSSRDCKGLPNRFHWFSSSILMDSDEIEKSWLIDHPMPHGV